MTFKKWVLVTGVVTNMLLISACDQSNEDEPSSTDPDQAEVEGNSDSDPTEENQNENNDETNEETSDEEENQNDENNQPDESDSTEDNNDQSDEQESDSVQLDLENDIINPSSIQVLVNKQYSLPEDYIPANLVTVDVPTVLPNPEIKQMRQVAADALKEMFDAAEQSGIILHARSGYRSYQTQVQLFQNYVSNHGEEAANKFSARPGESEHQTGLVMDVTSESVNLQITSEFGETEEGQWVRENGHNYGFIIRYPEGKQDITGYVYEPWHLRYLGRELASDVYESGLTYEEYLVDRGLDIEIQ